MLRSTTRNFLLATCIAAAPAIALAQSPAQQKAQTAPSQQNQQAQTAPRGTSQMSGKFLAAPQPDQMRAADLREADIYTADNQKVGDIDDILLDRQGKLVAVVVGVGGFLGIGEKKVAIPFESLEFQTADATVASDMSAPRTTTSTTTDRDRMATGAVPDNRAATDQERQRTTAQRAEETSRQQADRQADRSASQQANQQRQTTTTTTTTQRTAQATTGLWKPERVLLKGVTKADLQAAPEFDWNDNQRNRSGSSTTNAPSRNR